MQHVTDRYFSSGHPDKLADQLSDAIVDAYLRQDPEARVDCGVSLADSIVLLTGQAASIEHPDLGEVIRETICEAGYDRSQSACDERRCEILDRLQRYPAARPSGRNGIGSDAPGLVFGYATGQTTDLIPPALYLARWAIHLLERDCHDNPDSPLLPSAVCQTTIAVKGDGLVDSVDAMALWATHRASSSPDSAASYLRDLVAKRLPQSLPEKNLAEACSGARYLACCSRPEHFNGASGRQPSTELYGSECPACGTALSGKDGRDLHRSAAYAARHVAKNLVAAGLCDRATVQIAYARRLLAPLLLEVWGAVAGRGFDLTEPVRELVVLTPDSIQQRFHLDRPIFRATAAAGAFGHEPHGDYFAWEQTDLVPWIRPAPPL